MVLRRIVNGTIAGGMLGAALSSHLAEQHWRTQDMYSVRDDMGLPVFRRRLATDWPMTLQDSTGGMSWAGATCGNRPRWAALWARRSVRWRARP